MTETASETYPHLARWVTAYGWVEIGQDEYSRSFVRALDEGGMTWEGATSYPIGINRREGGQDRAAIGRARASFCGG